MTVGVLYLTPDMAEPGLVWFETRQEALRLMEQMIEVGSGYRASLVVPCPHGCVTEAL